MKVWLFNPYGPIPGEGWRDYRFTILGRKLAERGDFVTWWTANFSHHFKKFRSAGWEDQSVSERFRIRLVPTVSYKGNVSFGRLAYEGIYSWNAFRRALWEEPPDCIVGVDPSQIVGHMCVRLAGRLGVPLILDIFDRWPELFVLAFPRSLRWSAPVVLAPFYWLRKYNLRHADGITALCDTYMDVSKTVVLGLEAERVLTVFNGIDVAAFRASLPFGPERKALASERGKKPGEVWAVYAGTLGNNYDIQTLLRAASRLQELGNDSIRIWISGEGPLRSSIEECIGKNQLRNLNYMGRLTYLDLIMFYGLCDIGLSLYSSDSNVGMPDKAYDYMAAGLPIINSLQGEFEGLLRERGAGINYRAGETESLVDSLLRLGADEEWRLRMGRNSHDAALWYDQKEQFDRFADFIHGLIGRTGKRKGWERTGP